MLCKEGEHLRPGVGGGHGIISPARLRYRERAARLKKLTADELDRWMDERAAELSNRTLRLVHQILERAIRHAQARDKVRRNVASLIIVPEGQEGRPSKAMTLDQAIQLLDQVGPGSEHRLAAYVVVSLLAGVRTEEARALAWAEVDHDAGTVAVYRSVRAKGDTMRCPEPSGQSHPLEWATWKGEFLAPSEEELLTGF